MKQKGKENTLDRQESEENRKIRPGNSKQEAIKTKTSDKGATNQEMLKKN